MRPWLAAALLAACAGAPGKTPEKPDAPRPLPLYPLAAGAAWTYDVTVDYYGRDQEMHHWRGTVTREITHVERSGEAWIFALHTSPYPEQDDTWEHLVLTSAGLYRFHEGWDYRPFLAGRETDVGFAQILVDSPERAKRWGFFEGAESGYAWTWEGSEPITTPAGAFSDCRRATLRTNPDHTTVWYCPGVGPARQELGHHGTPRDETWTLRSFTPGAP